MNEHYHNLPRPLFSAVLVWLCCGAIRMAELNAQTFPPPVGAGIVATLQADQDVYTNQPAEFWCPRCTTNVPPCMLPCYLTNEEKTAVARFTFAVQNQYTNTTIPVRFSLAAASSLTSSSLITRPAWSPRGRTTSSPFSHHPPSPSHHSRSA